MPIKDFFTSYAVQDKAKPGGKAKPKQAPDKQASHAIADHYESAQAPKA